MSLLTKKKVYVLINAVRNFSNRNVKRGSNSRNSGRFKTTEQIATLEKRLSEYDDDEDYDETILKMDQVYDKHESEIAFRKNIADFKIIERKYFKEARKPHFLTTAAKMQIQYLHNMNPELWTPEKLSQSFPANERDIRKILKHSQQHWGSERGKKYDRIVLQNWKTYKEGKGGPIAASIDQIHENKHTDFSTSTLPAHLNSSGADDRFTSPKKIGQFSAIYNKINNPSVSNENRISNYGDVPAVNSMNRLVSKNSPSNKPMTIDKFKDTLLKTLGEKSQSDPSLMQMYSWLKNNSNSPSEELSTKDIDPIDTGKYYKNYERKFKKGLNTPKSNEDCILEKREDGFYDRKGELVYRVPTETMINKK